MTSTGPGAAVLAAALAAVAVLVGARASGPARRRLSRLGARPPSSVSARARRSGTRPWRRRPDPDPLARLGTLVTAVAAEVRAGRSPGEAWGLVLGAPVGPDGVPDAADVLAVLRPPRRGRATDAPAADPVRRRVAGVLAAGRLAAELGTPAAGVLEECARALAADADAETAVRSALAGPRQTTTLLTWLPVLGVVLGTLLGADPLGTLLDGGAGTAAGIAGVLLTLLGRRWTGRMVADARTARTGRDSGPDPDPGPDWTADGTAVRAGSRALPGAGVRQRPGRVTGTGARGG